MNIIETAANVFSQINEMSDNSCVMESKEKMIRRYDEIQNKVLDSLTATIEGVALVSGEERDSISVTNVVTKIKGSSLKQDLIESVQVKCNGIEGSVDDYVHRKVSETSYVDIPESEFVKAIIGVESDIRNAAVSEVDGAAERRKQEINEICRASEMSIAVGDIVTGAVAAKIKDRFVCQKIGRYWIKDEYSEAEARTLRMKTNVGPIVTRFLLTVSGYKIKKGGSDCTDNTRVRIESSYQGLWCDIDVENGGIARLVAFALPVRSLAIKESYIEMTAVTQESKVESTLLANVPDGVYVAPDDKEK